MLRLLDRWVELLRCPSSPRLLVRLVDVASSMICSSPKARSIQSVLRRSVSPGSSKTVPALLRIVPAASRP